MRRLKRKIIFVLLTFVFPMLGHMAADAQSSLFDSLFVSGTKAYQERRFAEAQKKLEAALKESDQLSPGDGRLSDLLKSLADIYQQERAYKKAEPLYKRLLVGLEKSPEPRNKEEIGAIQGKLAATQEAQGNYHEAIASYGLAIETLKEIASASVSAQEDCVSNMIKIGDCNSNLGMLKLAEENWREALKQAESYKENYSAQGRAFDALGRYYTESGRFDEADALLNQAMTVQQKISADKKRRLETSNTLINLGRLFRAQGKMWDSLDMLKTAARMRKDSLPESDFHRYDPAFETVITLRESGYYKDAVDEMERLQPALEKAFGEDSPQYAECLRQLATDYVSCSQYGKAEPNLRKALLIDENTYGKDSSQVCLDLNNFGMFYVFQGKYQEGEPLYKQALHNVEQRLGRDHVDVASALNNLSWLLVNQRRFGEARPLMERALAIRENSLGEKHPLVARNLNSLARLDLDDGKLDRAEKYLKRALKIQKEVLGAEHPDTIDTMSTLANVLKDRKLYSEAEEFYRKLLSVDEASTDKNQAYIAADLENLATVLIDQNRGDEAKPLRDKAHKIKKDLPGYLEAGGHGVNISAIHPGHSGALRAVADKWALVVGISNFKDSSINLQFAAKDAMDFRNYLIFEANFRPDHVKLLLDQTATRDNIVSHLGDKWLKKHARPDDLVVIYVSTHGTSARKEVGDANFIVAYETNLSNAVLSGIPMQWFTVGIKDLISAERVVIIMDVCHGGALKSLPVSASPGAIAKEHERPGSKALIRPNVGQGASGIGIGSGQIVLASSDSDQVSWESKLYANGVFTRQLIEGLRRGGQNATLLDAYKVMRGKVEQEVLRSRAEIQTPVLAVHEWKGGDVFLGVKPSAPRPLSSPAINADVKKTPLRQGSASTAKSRTK